MLIVDVADVDVVGAVGLVRRINSWYLPDTMVKDCTSKLRKRGMDYGVFLSLVDIE